MLDAKKPKHGSASLGLFLWNFYAGRELRFSEKTAAFPNWVANLGR